MSDAGSFPRLHARTQRFTLGSPRNLRVAADGSRIMFCRSDAGDDPVNKLWVRDVASGEERVLVDPQSLGAAAHLTDAERARRERAREGAGGIVTYDTDADLTVAVLALGGVISRVDVESGSVDELPAAPAAFDPRLDPTGSLVAYVAGPELRATAVGGPDRLIRADADPDISWGSAEFVAAEEMGRNRGYWWDPRGEHLLAARVDVSSVNRWWIASPADPATDPRAIRFPEAGGNNAVVDLVIVSNDGSDEVPVEWRGGEFEYLADASWSPRDEPTLVVMTRDQKTLAVLTVNPESGTCTEIHRQTDPAWVELVPGAPRWIEDRLLTVADRDGARRVFLDGEPMTPTDLQVRRIVGADASAMLVVGTTDATESHVYRIDYDGTIETVTETPGVHSAETGGNVVVVSSATLDTDGTATTVYQDRHDVATIASHAWGPGLMPVVHLMKAGESELNAGVLFPTDHDGASRLPVLLDPYGGPHGLRVQRARSQFLVSQWFADQGFAVVVADGRGTPARGGEWERAVRGDLAQPPLDDQIAALHAAASTNPQLDLDRVAIRGWSFGGYLAALAVLRRPDVFHAAVAGAPVTDWSLYDTFYTERYLGHPAEEPENYERSSIIDEAAALARPLLLIHGFADDNVVAAHTMGFSRALVEAGRPHQVLPLSGVTHMTPQEAVAENLLRLQADFLSQALS